MASVLLNHAGHPEPPPSVQRGLRQVHHGLHLRYSPSLQGVWAIALEWERSDPRWRMVQEQQMAATDAWDTIGFLPVDCPPDQAPSYVANALRSHRKEEVRHLAEWMHKYNAGVHTAHAQDALDDALSAHDPAQLESKKVTGRRTRHVVPKPE